MSYYWFNREKLLKMHGINIIIKEEYKRLLNIMLLTKKSKKKCKTKYGNLSEKEKNKKRRYQSERYHMNTDLNDNLKQYQRNHYASKK